MASRTITLYEDDLDGGEASQTVRFSLQGVEYEMDLSDENVNKLEDALKPFVAHARRIGGRKRASTAAPAKAKSNGTASTSEIREWAQEAGYEVSARGRISAAVREAYEAAH